jgi:hypothetical protein
VFLYFYLLFISDVRGVMGRDGEGEEKKGQK